MATPANVAAFLPAPALRRRDADLVDSLWDFFASLQLTIPVMVLLALGCTLGTFANPENRPMTEIVAAIGKAWWFPVYQFFELNDLFHSWWFLLLLVTITLNLAACTVERLPRIFKIALRPDKVVSEKLLRGLRHQDILQLPETDPKQAAGRVAGLFRAHGYQPEIFGGDKVPGGDPKAIYLFAERGRYSRFGVWTVHLSLFMILGGALIGRIGSAEGIINVPQDGSTFDFIFRKTSSGATYREPLGFTVRVDDFRLKKYLNGSPRSFESDLAVVANPGTPQQHDVLKQTILVGEPLEYHGWTIYQASYQAAPERDRLKLHILDKQTHEARDVVLGKEGEAHFGPVTFKAINFTTNLSQLGPAAQVERTEGKNHTRFWVLQKYPDFDTNDRGDRFGLRFDGLLPFFFTGLQVAKDPGYLWWLGGCCVLFLGLGIAFYTSHRRLWAKAEPGGKVTLAGAAHKNQGVFEELYLELLAALKPAAEPGAAPPGPPS